MLYFESFLFFIFYNWHEIFIDFFSLLIFFSPKRPLKISLFAQLLERGMNECLLDILFFSNKDSVKSKRASERKRVFLENVR